MSIDMILILGLRSLLICNKDHHITHSFSKLIDN